MSRKPFEAALASGKPTLFLDDPKEEDVEPTLEFLQRGKVRCRGTILIVGLPSSPFRRRLSERLEIRLYTDVIRARGMAGLAPINPGEGVLDRCHHPTGICLHHVT